MIHPKSLVYIVTLAFFHHGLIASAADVEPNEQGRYDLFGFFLGSGPHVCEALPEGAGAGSAIKRADMPKSSKVIFNAKTLTFPPFSFLLSLFFCCSCLQYSVLPCPEFPLPPPLSHQLPYFSLLPSFFFIVFFWVPLLLLMLFVLVPLPSWQRPAGAAAG